MEGQKSIGKKKMATARPATNTGPKKAAKKEKESPAIRVKSGQICGEIRRRTMAAKATRTKPSGSIKNKNPKTKNSKTKNPKTKTKTKSRSKSKPKSPK